MIDSIVVLLWDTVPANAVRCFMLKYDSTHSLNSNLYSSTFTLALILRRRLL